MHHIIQTTLMSFFVINYCFSFDLTDLPHTTTSHHGAPEPSHVLSPLVGEDGYFACQNLAGFEAGDQFTQYAWDWILFKHENSCRFHRDGDTDSDKDFLKKIFLKGYLHFLLNYAGLSPYNEFFYGVKERLSTIKLLISNELNEECCYRKCSMNLRILVKNMEKSKSFQDYFSCFPSAKSGRKKIIFMTLHRAIKALKKNQNFLDMGVAFHRAKIRIEKLTQELAKNDEKIFAYTSYQTTISLILLNWVRCVFLKIEQIGPNFSTNFFEIYIPEFLNPGEKYAAFLQAGHDVLPDAQNLPQIL